MRICIGLGAALLFLTSGCVHFSAQPLVPAWTATSSVHQQEQAGLSVAALAMGGGLSESEFLGRPARTKGYLPVVLFFENTGSTPFIIRRRGIRLRIGTHQVFNAAPFSEVYEATKFSKNSALWGLPLGIVPAFAMSEQIEKQNKQFLEDLRSKAFRDIRLWTSPRLYNCVVFFKMSSEQALKLTPKDMTVTIDVEGQGTEGEETTAIQFTLVPEDPLE